MSDKIKHQAKCIARCAVLMFILFLSFDNYLTNLKTIYCWSSGVVVRICVLGTCGSSVWSFSTIQPMKEVQYNINVGTVKVVSVLPLKGLCGAPLWRLRWPVGLPLSSRRPIFGGGPPISGLLLPRRSGLSRKRGLSPPPRSIPLHNTGEYQPDDKDLRQREGETET